MNIVEKFVFKILLVSLFMFTCVFIYAEDPITIPPTINIQGRLTTDYGDPITDQKTIYINDTQPGLNVKPDSDGLYREDVAISSFGFTSGNYPQSFKITVDGKHTDYKFSSVPYSLYSSTSNYAISAGTAATATNATNDGNGNNIESTYQLKINEDNKLSTSYISGLATVATSGSYNDLDNKPTIPAAQVNSDWNSESGVSEILNKPSLATVATSGSYNDLSDTPTIPAAQVNSDWNSESGVSEILNKPSLATVATSGSYNDLLDTPTIPAAQIQSDWNQANTESVDYIKNKPTVDTTYNSDSDNAQSGKAVAYAIANGTVNMAEKLDETEFPNDETNVDWMWVASGNKKTQGWKYIGTTEVGPGDLAEMYASSENLQPGDVVSIDTTRNDAVVKTKTAEDTKVAGVVSTEPGLLLNKNQKGYKLALVGKVPTKVCNEGGAIKRGDLLVSASVAGYAKKAGANPKPGTIIGKALENFSSNKKGTILVLVNLQ